jgi:hypothetical protein
VTDHLTEPPLKDAGIKTKISCHNFRDHRHHHVPAERWEARQCFPRGFLGEKEREKQLIAKWFTIRSPGWCENDVSKADHVTVYRIIRIAKNHRTNRKRAQHSHKVQSVLLEVEWRAEENFPRLWPVPFGPLKRRAGANVWLFTIDLYNPASAHVVTLEASDPAALS